MCVSYFRRQQIRLSFTLVVQLGPPASFSGGPSILLYRAAGVNKHVHLHPPTSDLIKKEGLDPLQSIGSYTSDHP